MATGENGFRACLRDFVSAHDNGWNHHEWLGLLAELTDAGYDTTNPDHIGMALERERVKRTLEQTSVKGLGPQRREAVAQSFGTVWNLQHASVEDLSEIPGLHRGLAQALHQALH
jgi:excinuclease ABC subunit C